MKFGIVKASLCLVVAGVTIGLCNVSAFAGGGLSSSLPAAGFGVTISEGISVKEAKEEVKTLVKVEKLDGQAETSLISQNAAVVEATMTIDKEIVDTQIPNEEERKHMGSSDTMGDALKEYYKNLVIAQVDSYVNVRDLPSEVDGKIVGKLYNNSVGDFIEEVDGWYKIKSGNCTGYVKGEYCVTGEDAVEVAKKVGKLIATVETTTLYVREDATTESKRLGMVGLGDELVVTEELEGWVKVDIEEGFGYVSKEYVTLSTEFVKAESKEEEEARLKKEKQEREKANAAARKASQATTATSEAAPATSAASISGSGAGVDVVNFALQFVGNPYVFGGTSLTNGADCSGFVMSVYANFGVSLPHSSAGDRNVGYDVGGVANAQPGDIVCYSGHVGIYIGNGQIVHASTSRTGIVVGSVNYRTPLCVRRIF